jgi:hypothetical protein
LAEFATDFVGMGKPYARYMEKSQQKGPRMWRNNLVVHVNNIIIVPIPGGSEPFVD